MVFLNTVTQNSGVREFFRVSLITKRKGTIKDYDKFKKKLE